MMEGGWDLYHLELVLYLGLSMTFFKVLRILLVSPRHWTKMQFIVIVKK